MKITALAGGVGGAKLAHGFSKLLNSDQFSVIVNTGDDFEHFGLYISPDMDTVCYTLAEISNIKNGWGRQEDTFQVLEAVRDIGGPLWFKLGDKDLAFHLERTRMLNLGFTLTEVAFALEKAIGLKHSILPMCDENVSTMVETNEFGEISFQEYFVKHQCEPVIKGFRFKGLESATITQAAKKALIEADTIVICPSNPFVSIFPIISLKGVMDILKNKYVIGVSPIIGGKAVKGPLAKMLRETGWEVNQLSIMQMYQDFLDCWYIDNQDVTKSMYDHPPGVILKAENIFLPDVNARVKLAKSIINHIEEINK